MKLFAVIFLFFSAFSIFNCKPKHVLPVNNFQEIINDNEIIIANKSSSSLSQLENLQEEKPSNNIDGLDLLMEKPILTISDKVYLELNNKIIIYFDLKLPSFNTKCYEMNIDIIKIYDSANKEADFIEITDKNIMLFKLKESEDWLYLITHDFENHGFVNIYDISKNAFYGDLKENAKSGNWYGLRLNIEYEIINDNQNISRYGPLLEIKYIDNVIRIWDSFSGLLTMGKYLLLDYYKEYNEILIYKQYFEGSDLLIYNLKLEDFVCKIGDTPYFNNSRNAVFSLVYYYGDPGVNLKIFLIEDAVYEEIIDEHIPLGYSPLINALWINDNEFQIDYTKEYYKENDKVTEELLGESGTLLVRRDNQKSEFELIYN